MGSGNSALRDMHMAPMRMICRCRVSSRSVWGTAHPHGARWSCAPGPAVLVGVQCTVESMVSLCRSGQRWLHRLLVRPVACVL